MRWDAMLRNATDNAAIPIDRTSLPVISTIKARRKRWNQTAYLKIKAKRTTPQTVAKGDWLCRADGKARRSSNAIKMAKMRRVKPAVDQITTAVSVEDQAALLRAVAGHRNLAAACQFAGINSSLNDTNADTANYLCGQSARMLGRACSNETATSRDKQDAIQTTLMMMGPSPNKIGDVPSIRKRARLLGIPSTKFFRSE